MLFRKMYFCYLQIILRSFKMFVIVHVCVYLHVRTEDSFLGTGSPPSTP